MDYTITSVYDDDAYAALITLMMTKLRRWPRYLILATGFLSVIGGGAYMFATGRFEALTVLVVLLGGMMCMLGFLAPKVAFRMMKASNPKGATPVNTYRFTGAGMSVSNGSKEKSYSYAAMKRLLEMSGYLFLFMDDSQVYLLRQKDVKGGYRRFHDDLESAVAAARR